jgi:hypothetical protein
MNCTAERVALAIRESVLLTRIARLAVHDMSPLPAPGKVFGACADTGARHATVTMLGIVYRYLEHHGLPRDDFLEEARDAVALLEEGAAS